jgi:hypothetical protein
MLEANTPFVHRLRVHVRRSAVLLEGKLENVKTSIMGTIRLAESPLLACFAYNVVGERITAWCRIRPASADHIHC